MKILVHEHLLRLEENQERIIIIIKKGGTREILCVCE